MQEGTGGGTVAFGVVTPTLNAERYLQETLDSVWGQRGTLVEIDHLIVDGGSTDRTAEMSAESRSRFVSSHDGGMYEAINTGMSLVRGDILGYINGDDEIAPGAFGRIAQAFEARPDVQWLCGRVEYIDGSGEVLGRMKPVRLSVRSYVGIGWSCIPQQTVWFRRTFFERVGPFNTAYKNCADYEWYVRALCLQHPLILDEVLGRFRLHGAQLSFNPEIMARESRMVQEQNGGLGFGSFLRGKLLSLRLNAMNPRWLVAKKTGRIRFTD